MGEVVADPVAFPPTKQAFARIGDLGMIEWQILRRLFKHHLAHVGRIDGDPAEILEPHLGAAVLCLGDILRACPEALVAEGGRRNPQAVDVGAESPAARARPT